MPASSIQTVTIGASAETQLVGPNPRRRRIAFTVNTSGATFIRPDTQNGAALIGFVLTLAGGPYEISREKHGDLVESAWFANTTTGAGLVGILETLE